VYSDVVIDENLPDDDTKNPLKLVNRCDSLAECTSVDHVLANILNQHYAKKKEPDEGGVCKEICKLFATKNGGADDSLPKLDSAGLLFGASGESANSPEAITDAVAMDGVPETIAFDVDEDDNDDDDDDDVIFVEENKIENTKSSSSSSSFGSSSFALKDSSNEIDGMFLELNKLTRTFVNDSNDVFEKRMAAYQEQISKLEEMLETKEIVLQLQQDELDELVEEKAFLNQVVRAYSTIRQYEHSIENHTVHFVADFGDASSSSPPSSNDEKPRPLKRWLMLPSTDRVERFMKTQVDKKNIVYSHDFGVFNAPTYGEGLFKRLRKWAKELSIQFGYVPGKDDWIPAMVAYGLFRRLHVLVSAAALEFRSVRYFVFTGFDFNAVQNHYSGIMITSPKLTLHRTKNSIVNVSHDGCDGGGLRLRRADDANAQQPEPLVIQEEDRDQIPFFQGEEPHPRREEEGEGRGGGGRDGGGGQIPLPLPPPPLPPPPPPVEPEVHERARGGLFEPFAEWTSETAALVTLSRAIALYKALKEDGSFAEKNQLVFFSVKASTAMREALGVFFSDKEGDIRGALEVAVDHETREKALKLINGVLSKGNYPKEAKKSFDEIVGQTERHPSRPSPNVDAQMTQTYETYAERFPKSAPFFARVDKWCPIKFSAGANVFIDRLTKKETGGDDEDDDEDFVSLGKGKKNVFMAGSKRKTQKTSAQQQQQQQQRRRQRQKMPPPPQQQQSGRQTENTQDSDTGIWLADFKCQKCPAECPAKISGTLWEMGNEAQPFTFRIGHTVNGKKCINDMNVGTEKGRGILFNGIVDFPPEAKKAVFDGLVEKAIPAYKKKIKASLRIGSKYEPWDVKRETRYELTLEDVKKSFSVYMNSGGKDFGVKDHEVEIPLKFKCFRCNHVMEEEDKKRNNGKGFKFLIPKDKPAGSVKNGHPSNNPLDNRNNCKPYTNFTKKEEVTRFVETDLKEVPLQEKINTLEALLAKFAHVSKQDDYKKKLTSVVLDKVQTNINEHLLKFKKSEHVMF
jgi:hypothetical protein